MLFRNILLLGCVVLVLSECPINKDSHTVATANGCLAGRKTNDYVAFEGIRYAEPPIGEMRFEPPKPYAETWQGVRNATATGPMCMQMNLFNGYKLEGAEDCLFLNVYVPTQPQESSDEMKKLPVLVHIHGGGFLFGDATFYGPELLMKAGKFVYVSLNYRLGALGFLSTNCHLVPGNMGLKDQVVALKWVQDNIAAFGGDPANVLLTGFSAGAASVHFHYMSLQSTGLFHRGISHSGSALNPWATVKNPLSVALILAGKLNCTRESHSEMIACLKTQPAETILYNSRKDSEYAAVVEYEHEGAFLTDTPVNYLKAGRIQKLPWLVSATQDEADDFISFNYLNETYWQEMNDHWTELMVKHLKPKDTDPEVIEGVAQKVKTYYFKDEPLTQKNALKVAKMYTDWGFLYGIAESAELQAKSAPVYCYFYKYKLNVGLGSLWLKSLPQSARTEFGSVHGDDVLLIYSTPAHAADDFKYSEDEVKMTENLLGMYDTFINDGVPKFGETPLTRATDKLEYTDIEGPETAVVGRTEPLCDMDLWTELKQKLQL